MESTDLRCMGDGGIHDSLGVENSSVFLPESLRGRGGGRICVCSVSLIEWLVHGLGPDPPGNAVRVELAWEHRSAWWSVGIVSSGITDRRQ